MLWGKSESLHVRQKMSITRRTSLLCSRAFVIEAKHARIRVAGVDWLKPIPFNDWTVGQPLSELHWIWKRIKFRSSVSVTVPLVSSSVKSGLQNLAKSLHVFSLLLSLTLNMLEGVVRVSQGFLGLQSNFGFLLTEHSDLVSVIRTPSGVIRAVQSLKEASRDTQCGNWSFLDLRVITHDILERCQKFGISVIKTNFSLRKRILNSNQLNLVSLQSKHI